MSVIVKASPFFYLLSKQWTVQILYRLAENETHFNKLKDDLSGISAKVLTERVRELEDWDFVSKEKVGNKVVYNLSHLGKELHGNLDYLDVWLESWFTKAPEVTTEGMPVMT